MEKRCPFNCTACDSGCALFIKPDDMNETFRNKLKSINVFNDEGMCSLKTLALSEARYIYEASGKVR